MTHQKFKLIKIIIAMLLAAVIAQAVIFSNYVLAAFAVAAAIAVILVARKKVDEVLADERDYKIAGKAAKVSLNIFSVIGAAATFVLMAQDRANPVYEAVGSVLAYSVCGLLLLYSAVYVYFEKYAKQD